MLKWQLIGIKSEETMLKKSSLFQSLFKKDA